MPAFSKKGAAWRPPDRDRNINVLLIRAYFLAPILGLLTLRTVLANNLFTHSCAVCHRLHVVELPGIVSAGEHNESGKFHHA